MKGVQVEQVSKFFFSERDHSEVHVLDNVSFTMKDKEFFTVIGHSGCGKTTLLTIIAGFEAPSSGRVLVDGKEVTGTSPDRAMVFQDYALFPWLTVFDNVAFGLQAKGMPRGERQAIVEHYMELVGLTSAVKKFPRELSGGMAQRVAIARALAISPSILLMDEPFGALDEQTRTYMQAELIRILEQERRAVLFVTHSIEEAVRLSDRVAVMTRGPGRIKTICHIPYERPRDDFAERVIALRHELTQWLRKKEEGEK